MLVLARKPNQSIMIGDDIEIRVVDIKGDQVKIGITAPRSISVHRKEIYEEIQAANIEASKANAETDLENLSKIIVKKKKKDS
ncbi:MAG: carbon storage regulator CsrA [Spirochaetota bacterium]|nr:carbon storage regulator CsrA [Spirochaetota bacterium]